MTKEAADRINSAAERLSRLPEPEKGVQSKRMDEYVRNSIALDPDTSGQRSKARPLVRR